MGKRKAGLHSRPWDKGLSSLQLGESITFAQEAVREVVAIGLGQKVFWKRWNVILPNEKKKDDPLHDPDGHVLKGELASSVLDSKGWGPCAHNTILTRRMQDILLERSQRGYDMLHYERENGIDMRHIMFSAVAAVSNSTHCQRRQYSAIVRVWALSGWWHSTDVTLWTWPAGVSPTRLDCRRGKFSYTLGQTVVTLSELTSSLPPSFLWH